jgi:hypothetical protein
MPLVDLRTNLKSFKYGHDRQGGGDSGQPFITTNIDTGATSVSVGSRNILRLFGIREIPGIPNIGVLLNRSRVGRVANEILSGDELIRGGITGAAQAALNDTLRIGAFFLTAPKGPIFVAQQVGLQLSNPRLETKQLPTNGTGLIGSIVRTVNKINNLVGPTRIYNLGLNTVAQVPVNAFGGHFYRHGVLPIQDEDSKYAYVAYYNNVNGNNRLVRLANKFELGDNEFEATPGLFDLKKANKANRKINKDARQATRQQNKAAKQAAIVKRDNLIAQRNLRQNLTPNPPLSPIGTGAPSPLQPLPSQQSAAIGAYILGLPAPPATSPPPPVSGRLSNFGYNKLPKLKRNKLNLNGANNVIDSYLGGPDSVYGIGLTVIKRYEFTEDKLRYDDAIKAADNNAGRGILNGERQPITYVDPTTLESILENTLGDGPKSISEYDGVIDDIPTISQGIDIGVLSKYSSLVAKIQFQQSNLNTTISNTDRNVAGGVGWASTGYNAVKNDNSGSTGFSSTQLPGSKITYTNTYGESVAITGSNWSRLSRAVRVGSGRTDSINLTPLFKIGTGYDNTAVEINGTIHTINDLCKFRIEAIDSTNPTNSVYMVFRAYLTDLSDDVSAEWNDVKYAGRGEKFYVYNGFSRTINVSFKVAALSAAEMEPMYRKLNHLMGNLMPDYSPGNTGFPGTTTGVMRGPLVRMTIGNWIDSQPGVLKSLSYKIPQDSPWEIALPEPIGGGSRREMILPHIVEVNLSFTPIGSQTQNINKTPSKADADEHTSHIAQNYNGATSGEPNYINGQTIQNGVKSGYPSRVY